MDWPSLTPQDFWDLMKNGAMVLRLWHDLVPTPPLAGVRHRATLDNTFCVGLKTQGESLKCHMDIAAGDAAAAEHFKREFYAFVALFVLLPVFCCWRASVRPTLGAVFVSSLAFVTLSASYAYRNWLVLGGGGASEQIEVTWLATTWYFVVILMMGWSLPDPRGLQRDILHGVQGIGKDVRSQKEALEEAVNEQQRTLATMQLMLETIIPCINNPLPPPKAPPKAPKPPKAPR